MYGLWNGEKCRERSGESGRSEGRGEPREGEKRREWRGKKESEGEGEVGEHPREIGRSTLKGREEGCRRRRKRRSK